MLITHSTFIACPTQQVWQATTDIDRWPEWAPTVQTARRLDKQHFRVGSQASIKQPMQSRAIWTVTEMEEVKYFQWETSGKAFRMKATHRVTSRGEGTICTLEVRLIGPAAMVCAPVLVPFIWFALMQENRGLKRWCEAGRGPASTPGNHPIYSPTVAAEQIPRSSEFIKG